MLGRLGEMVALAVAGCMIYDDLDAGPLTCGQHDLWEVRHQRTLVNCCKRAGRDSRSAMCLIGL